ncbi:hypothetical protein HAX54_000706, partial [Datura stramonium]|nr:hypothetical protein [Datura stramonium]
MWWRLDLICPAAKKTRPSKILSNRAKGTSSILQPQGLVKGKGKAFNRKLFDQDDENVRRDIDDDGSKSKKVEASKVPQDRDLVPPPVPIIVKGHGK